MTVYERVLDLTKDEVPYPVDVEVEALLRDPETLETIRARAILRSSFAEYPEADTLYYCSATQGRVKEPVPIEILRFEEDETEEVEALPTQKLSLGERRGTMLSQMIRDRADKMK